jgi:UDP-2-acetamido-2,6-beta-L-arabino-hexul-4-ose reductase
MRIIVTGANGFIGKNLCSRLIELGYADTFGLTRYTAHYDFQQALASADFVFHLAGINRPDNPNDFFLGNALLTQNICDVLAKTGRRIPVVFTSSIHTSYPESLYGRSKLDAEITLQKYASSTQSPVYIYRLSNVFGKWCRPNYNSAIATFCHNLAHGEPVVIHDGTSPLKLVYVDDVVRSLTSLLSKPSPISEFMEVDPIYLTTVSEVVDILTGFTQSRIFFSEEVGDGLAGCLYSTFISYLPTQAFSYQLTSHKDPRGEFVEMLKTPKSGQISYLTVNSGATRGDHFHHSKIEKFLVIKGTAHFSFRHILTNEIYDLVVRGGDARVVETIPGWTHNIKNIGSEELIVMLWANSVFNPQNPDTIPLKV